ncbi:helix-turn-helix domain-containing protein [Brevibacillus formosus]|uniref:helix-turn-helix domain-containing protein n=1 Tax=Brevibacillus formosus TaxID=54913 RepID=UPI003F1CC2E2
MSLGQRLKACRKAKKLTQLDLSETLGFNRSTYAKYETGDNEPDNQTLQKLADFFGVSVDYLLGRTDVDYIVKEENSHYDKSSSAIDKKDTGLSEFENLFFFELDKLSEEDKRKALEHVRYLRFLAEQQK